MALIQGKDWAFEVSDEDLVKIALRTILDNNEKITLRSVSELSGLDVQTVRTIIQQMVAVQKGQ